MIAAILLFVALFFIARFYINLKNYPPGPLPLPLIGNALHIALLQWLGKSAPDILYDWKKKYGNVVTFWLGPELSVCVLDYDLAVETYVKYGDLFVLRQSVPILDAMREGLGIVFSLGDLWVEQRRFALHTLRDFGLGKNLMQEMILDEYHSRMDPLDAEIEKNGGELLINPEKKFLQLMIGSIINRLLVGYSFDKSNMDEFIEIRRQLRQVNDSFTFLDTVLLRPGLWSLPYIKQRFDFIIKGNNDGMAFAVRQIANRQADIASGKYHLDEFDFIDAFLMERKRSMKQLSYSIMDMWQAGMDTTIATLSWGLLYLLKNPEVQEKMRKELIEVCGKERDVGLADRQLLPYCNAAITEVHRTTSLVKLNLMRRNTKDTVIGGFHVPTGTDNAVIMSVIFKDDTVFNNPDRFDPERYLDENGKEAEQKVLLNIIKSYRIIDHENVPSDWLKGSPNTFTRVPLQYECIFEKVN